MKKFLYWFAWLQVGMPFLVATTTFTVIFTELSAGKPMPPLIAMGKGAVGGLAYGAIGLLIFAPYLAVNALLMSAILRSLVGKKEKALVLALDCAATFAFVFFGLSGVEKPGTAGTFAWFSSGTLVSLLALKWEPATGRKTVQA